MHTRCDPQNQLKQTQDALHAAEEAATHATDMCAQLNEAILVLNASDTARRKQLATRAYNLKEALLVSNSRLRQKADDVRKGKLETAAMLKMKEAWMQAEVIAAEANAKADYAVFESEAARFKLAYERMRKPFRMGGMAYQVVRTDIAA